MVSIIFLISIVCIFLAPTSNSYVMEGSTISPLPTQYGHPKNYQKFYRLGVEDTLKQRFKMLSCPDGYRFDGDRMRCTKLSEAGTPQSQLNCPAGYRGTMGYSANCRNFVNCWDGVGFVGTCTAHLVWSEQIRDCDYPEQANCCEYPGKDSSKLVQ